MEKAVIQKQVMHHGNCKDMKLSINRWNKQLGYDQECAIDYNQLVTLEIVQIQHLEALECSKLPGVHFKNYIII